MRLQELLTEKINLSIYRDEIEDSLKSSILGAMKHFSKKDKNDFKFGLSDEEIKNLEDKGELTDTIFKKLSEQLSNYLETFLQNKLSSICRDILKQEFEKEDREVRVIFSDNIGSSRGRVPVNDDPFDTVYLSKKYYFKSLMGFIQNDIKQHILNLVDEDEPFYDVLIDALSNPQIDYRYENYLSDIVGTLIHELVHVVQHRKQYASGRKPEELEYRSYVEPDKDKFYSELNAMNKLSTNSKNNNKLGDRLHKSSPQEISAHANEIVLSIFNYYREFFNDIDELQSIKSTLFDNLKSYVNEYLQHFDPSVRNDKKVRDRYLKLAYQKLSDFIEKREEKLRKK